MKLSKVSRPDEFAQSYRRAVQHADELCGLLPAARSVGQRVDSFDHAFDALLSQALSTFR
jgi:hypothetical protein